MCIRDRLLGATRSIAQGNLDTALSEDFGIFESYKSQLRQIQMDFKRAVDEEVKSQRMKTELITNAVSYTHLDVYKRQV